MGRGRKPRSAPTKAFAYVFVILLILYVSAQATGKFSEVRIPKPLKITAIGLSFVLLSPTSFLAYALPVFTLSNPTGSYAVGTKYFDVVDESRADPFLDKSPRKRELMVKVCYPAKDDDSKPCSTYFHNSPKLLRAGAAFYHVPSFMFSHLRLVKTHSKDGLELSKQQSSYPVVLSSHGAGTTMEIETSQSEDLASHGYMPKLRATTELRASMLSGTAS
jgi:predicted dienelactone hydrolase